MLGNQNEKYYLAIQFWNCRNIKFLSNLVVVVVVVVCYAVVVEWLKHRTHMTVDCCSCLTALLNQI